MMRSIYTFLRSFLLIFSILLTNFQEKAQAQQGHIIPTDTQQGKFTKAYKLVMEASDEHYRSTGSYMDKVLFPEYGEHSIYWIGGGERKGDFVFPDEIPQDFQFVKTAAYQNYNWQTEPHFSIDFQKQPKLVAIFKSAFQADSITLSWQALQFIRLFESYLPEDIFYLIDEEELAQQGLSDSTKLLIIPSFTVKGEIIPTISTVLWDLDLTSEPGWRISFPEGA